MRFSTPRLFVIVTPIFLLSFCAQPQCVSSPYLIREREVPAPYQRAYLFLEFLKSPHARTQRFDPASAPRWDPRTLLSFVSEKGVVLTDVNDSSTRTFPVAQLHREIVARRGPGFEMLAHLAHIYSIPYRQYSELTFALENDELKVQVAGWYGLTFRSEHGRWQLARCDYNQLEGEQARLQEYVFGSEQFREEHYIVSASGKRQEYGGIGCICVPSVEHVPTQVTCNAL